MSRIVVTLLLSTLLVLFTSCTQDTFVDVRDSTVTAKLDLVVGFEGRLVKLYLNGELSYSATLGTMAPLSRPIAEFESTLLRGTNTIVVECWATESPGTTYMRRTTAVTLGDADKYFLGLILQSDTLLVNVQTSPFLYL